MITYGKTFISIIIKHTWHSKASVTIMAYFCPEFNPLFRWRCKHKTKIVVHINNLVSSEFPNRPNRSARSFISTLNCT